MLESLNEVGNRTDQVLAKPRMRLMLRIDDGCRHRRVERHSVGMALIVCHHVHPGVQRGLGPLLGARESADDAAITLVQDRGEQLVLRGVVMQEPRL